LVTSALALNDIDAFYGDSHVLQKVSFQLGEGRLLGLLGRNGAGKSTCMNVVVGLLPARGRIAYDGRAVAPLEVEERVAQGLCLVPERRELFGAMSVADNLALGAFHRRRENEVEVRSSLENVYARFPRLAERRAQLVAHGVERRDHGGGEFAGFFQHRVNDVLGKIAVKPLVHRLLQPGRVLERERDVGNRRAVGHICSLDG